MNIFNHLRIARVVQQTIEDELSVKIDTMAFRYGNIKPDISADFVKIPHNIDAAMEFIDQQIKDLIGTKVTTSPVFTKQFSEKLGIITHYLSDFFCYAHSDNYRGSHLSHHFYEISLSRYFNKHLKKIKNHKKIKFFKIYCDKISIHSYVCKQHTLYVKKSPSYPVDTYFTIEICISVCTSIISACLFKSLKNHEMLP